VRRRGASRDSQSNPEYQHLVDKALALGLVPEVA